MLVETAAAAPAGAEEARWRLAGVGGEMVTAAQWENMWLL